MRAFTALGLTLAVAATAAQAQVMAQPGEHQALTREALTARRGMLLESRPSLAPRILATLIGAIELVAGTSLLVFASGPGGDVGGIDALLLMIPITLVLEGLFRCAFGVISMSLGVRDRYDADEQLGHIDAELARRSPPQPGAQ